MGRSPVCLRTRGAKILKLRLLIKTKQKREIDVLIDVSGFLFFLNQPVELVEEILQRRTFSGCLVSEKYYCIVFSVCPIISVLSKHPFMFCSVDDYTAVVRILDMLNGGGSVKCTF